MEIIILKQLIQKSAVIIFFKTFLRGVLFCLFFSLFLVLFQVHLANADDEESLSDIPQYWSTTKKYHWIFATTDDLQDILISINDRPISNESAQLKRYSSVIHASIPLELEKNSLIVVYIKEKMVFSGDFFYAKSFHGEVVPEEYEPFLFHTLENESTCLPCHRLQVNKEDIAPISPSTSLCYPCHYSSFPKSKVKHSSNVDKNTEMNRPTLLTDADLTGQESRHDIAGTKWQCLSCHQAEAIESEFIPDIFFKFSIKEGAKVAPLCYKCHSERQELNEAFTYVHGPIGMGGCNMCHNPHFSSVGELLEDIPSILCINCHEFEESLTKTFVHSPLKKEGCITCHDPHGSDYNFQLNDAINTLCLRCHEKIAKQQNNHPVTGHPVSGAKDPRDPDLIMTCVSCHDPHSSDYENLLPEEEPMMLCVQCHKMGG